MYQSQTIQHTIENKSNTLLKEQIEKSNKNLEVTIIKKHADLGALDNCCGIDLMVFNKDTNKISYISHRNKSSKYTNPEYFEYRVQRLYNFYDGPINCFMEKYEGDGRITDKIENILGTYTFKKYNMVEKDIYNSFTVYSYFNENGQFKYKIYNSEYLKKIVYKQENNLNELYKNYLKFFSEEKNNFKVSSDIANNNKFLYAGNYFNNSCGDFIIMFLKKDLNNKFFEETCILNVEDIYHNIREESKKEQIERVKDYTICCEILFKIPSNLI